MHGLLNENDSAHLIAFRQISIMQHLLHRPCSRLLIAGPVPVQCHVAQPLSDIAPCTNLISCQSSLCTALGSDSPVLQLLHQWNSINYENFNLLLKFMLVSMWRDSDRMLLSWFYESSDQAVESLHPFYILNFNWFMELVNFCLVC